MWAKESQTLTLTNLFLVGTQPLPFVQDTAGGKFVLAATVESPELITLGQRDSWLMFS